MKNDSQGSQAKILDLFILSCFCRDGALLGFVCPHYHGLRGKGLIRHTVHFEGMQRLFRCGPHPQSPKNLQGSFKVYSYIVYKTEEDVVVGRTYPEPSLTVVPVPPYVA